MQEKNKCILHDKNVYQLINPNITSSHLKRNSKLVCKKLRSRLRANICYMESVFISVFHFISVSCNLPYNNHLVSFAIFFRFIFIRIIIIFRAILIYKRLSSQSVSDKMSKQIVVCSRDHNFLCRTENVRCLSLDKAKGIDWAYMQTTIKFYKSCYICNNFHMIGMNTFRHITMFKQTHFKF